jgi:hypothetical protein
MKTTVKLTLILSLAAMLAGCGASNVITDADPLANFSKYHTFRFTDNDDQAGINPLYHSSLLDNAIHAQIAIELENRGIREDVDKPDMFIAYHTYTEKKRSSINNYYPMMYGGWGWRFYPWGFNPYPFGYWNGYNTTQEYTEGTLIIDAIDATNNQLIWRGSISDVINSPQDLHGKAVKAVQMIFKKFPIRNADRLMPSESKPVARSRK